MHNNLIYGNISFFPNVYEIKTIQRKEECFWELSRNVNLITRQGKLLSSGKL